MTSCPWCAIDGREGCPDHYRRERWLVRAAMIAAVAVTVITYLILARA